MGIVKQARLTDPRYASISSPYFHKLRGPGAVPTEATSQLLELLSDVLTLRCGDELDYALALDWYKSPIEGCDPQAWPNTSTGDLVSQGKYWYKGQADAARLRVCGRALTRRLVKIVGRHPLLRDVTAIAAAPGHDVMILSFGARLAAAVAKDLDKPLVRCRSLVDFRRPLKGLDQRERASVIHNQFACDEDVDGWSLLIVDDVYSSGSTTDEAARALRAAGATRVSSLCAVRTMRF